MIGRSQYCAAKLSTDTLNMQKGFKVLLKNTLTILYELEQELAWHAKRAMITVVRVKSFAGNQCSSLSSGT